MQLSGTSLRRFWALVLPIALVWGFASCVFICAEHLTEQWEHNAELSSVVLNASHDTDCCPVVMAAVELPQSALVLKASLYIVPPVSFDHSSTLTSVSASTLHHFLDPPLKRLSALRI